MRTRNTVIAAVLAFGLIGCGYEEPTGDGQEAATAEPATRSLTGKVIVRAGHNHSPNHIAGARSNISISSEGVGSGPPYTCKGSRDFADLVEGATVAVLDGQGDTIGLGRLSEGEYVATHYGRRLTDAEIEHADEVWRWMQRREGDEPEGWDGDYIFYSTSCLFSFSVELTDSAPFYSVQIAEREDLRFTHQELDEAEWYVEEEYTSVVMP